MTTPSTTRELAVTRIRPSLNVVTLIAALAVWAIILSAGILVYIFT